MYSRRRGAQVTGIDAAADAAADAARDIAESQPVEDDPRLVRGLRDLYRGIVGWPKSVCNSRIWTGLLTFCNATTLSSRWRVVGFATGCVSGNTAPRRR